MKQVYILPILMVFGLNLNAQKILTGCPKVFFTSLQVLDTLCDNNIKQVGHSPFSGEVIIKYKNKEKQYLSEDSVWGIRRRSDYPYRIYESNYYRLYELSPLFKYSRRVGKSTHYYFSIALDSPIYSYNKRQLKQHTDSLTYASIARDNNTNIHDIGFDFFVLSTTLLNNKFWGGGLNIRYYPSKKFSTGIYIALSGRQVKDTFGFSIRQPVITNAEIGWVNQYDFVQTEKFRTSITLINGLAVSDLRDKAIKETIKTSKGYRKVSKKIADNYGYLLEPGLDFSVRLFENSHNPDFYVNAKTNYRFVWSSQKFGAPATYNGFLFSMGLSLIGFSKEVF